MSPVSSAVSASKLGPSNWDEYVGQEALKRTLRTHAKASLITGQRMEHVLLTGPPGVGKTTIARLLAMELGLDPLFADLVMPIPMPQLYGILLDHRIVFLDEIHRLGRSQEDLLSILEDGQVKSRGLWYDVSHATIVAATTDPDKILPAVYDRFGIRPQFTAYDAEEMECIVTGMAQRADVPLSRQVIAAIGVASAGAPRQARTFILAAKALYEVNGEPPSVRELMEFCQYREDGLSLADIRYLNLLNRLGGKAGAKRLATSLRTPVGALEEMESKLAMRGLITYTASGRELSPRGWSLVRAEAGSNRD